MRIILVALAIFSTRAQALTLAQHEHTVWGTKDGAGGAVIWASDTPNGMMLLKTSTGYQVFDGIEFHSIGPDRPPPLGDYAETLGQRSPTGAIYYVHPTTDKLMRTWNGRTEEVDDKVNTTRWKNRFVFEQGGVGWFSALDKVYRLEGLKVDIVGADWGLPRDVAMGAVFVDERGTVWIGSEEKSAAGHGALYFLPKGARKFERFAQAVQCLPMVEAPDGSLWCTSDEGVAVVTIRDGRPVDKRMLPDVPSSAAIAFDRRGGFWMATHAGLAHVSDWHALLAPGGAAALKADTMTTAQGLSSDGIWTIFEDTAGSIWLTTGAGLERFRATRFTQVKLPRRGFVSALAPDADGSLWVGNWDGVLMHLSDGKIEDIPDINYVTAIRNDESGRIWVAGGNGIYCKEPGGKFSVVTTPPLATMQYIRQIAQDDGGAMWFQPSRRLIRLRDGVWSNPEGPGVPPSDTFYLMLADAQRQLWFAGDKRGPFVLRNGVFRELHPAAYAASVEKAYAGYVRGPHVWIGGTQGVGAFIGDEFHPLRIKDNVARSLSGIVETPQGDLWLHGLTKAFHLTADQVAAGLKGDVVTPDVYDFRDGLTAAASLVEPRPTLVQDVAGRLWFSTNQGLFWTDPRASPPAAASPPSTLLWAVRSDGQRVAPGPGLTLPENPGRTEFDYAAAALGVSDRVHFRYRIDGIDKDWQDAGSHRTAVYTQLPPGAHRFEVLASNEQGAWASSPTVLAFEVRAAWYQTWWFRAFVVMVGIGLLGSAYLLRVGVLAARERARARAIAAERERIARDLHDTLLQSMQGVILGFQALATTLPPRDATRRLIEGRLDHADQLLGEARDRVRNLRTASDDAPSLGDAFRIAIAELAGPASMEVVEQGKPRALRSFAREAIYLVGREALLNAVVHGHSTQIQVHLEFAPKRFVLRVRDNGIGIDPQYLAKGARPGHYGLVGMRERAAQLGADFTVTRVASGGTDVVLTVPATHAFEQASATGWWRELSQRAPLWLPRTPRIFRKKEASDKA